MYSQCSYLSAERERKGEKKRVHYAPFPKDAFDSKQLSILCSVLSIVLYSHINNIFGPILISFIPISEGSSIHLVFISLPSKIPSNLILYPSSAAGCGQEVWSVVVYMLLPVMSASNNSCMTSLPLSLLSCG